MKSEEFWPGEKVIVLNNDEGIAPGQIGVIKSKWRDTLYVIRGNDGLFHFVDNTEVSSIASDRHSISTGDIIKISSGKHNHPFAKEGELFRVIKILEDMDSYEVLFDGKRYFLSNFELANYLNGPL